MIGSSCCRFRIPLLTWLWFNSFVIRDLALTDKGSFHSLAQNYLIESWRTHFVPQRLICRRFEILYIESARNWKKTLSFLSWYVFDQDLDHRRHAMISVQQTSISFPYLIRIVKRSNQKKQPEPIYLWMYVCMCMRKPHFSFLLLWQSIASYRKVITCTRKKSRYLIQLVIEILETAKSTWWIRSYAVWNYEWGKRQFRQQRKVDRRAINHLPTAECEVRRRRNIHATFIRGFVINNSSFFDRLWSGNSDFRLPRKTCTFPTRFHFECIIISAAAAAWEDVLIEFSTISSSREISQGLNWKIRASLKMEWNGWTNKVNNHFLLLQENCHWVKIGGT